MYDPRNSEEADPGMHSREKYYLPGETIKTLLFSTMEKDVYAKTVIPKFLYRGDNHRERLEQIPQSGFMVAFSKGAALEYGDWVATYEFLGGTIGLGIENYLTKFMDLEEEDASAWHHQVSPDSCEAYGGDLILPTEGEDNHGIICNPDLIRLVKIESLEEVKNKWEDSRQHNRRNPDEDLRDLERQLEAENEPEIRLKFFRHLLRAGQADQIDAYITQKLQEKIMEVTDPAVLWYWKTRFQEGHDVSFPTVNDSQASLRHPCHGRSYNVLLQHPSNKLPVESIGDRGTLSQWTKPRGQLETEAKWHHTKPLVIFFDSHDPRTGKPLQGASRYGHLGVRTPGSYYVETLLENYPEREIERLINSSVGLSLHGGEPVWSVDGPAYYQVLQVLHHVTEGWMPLEPTGEHRKLLKQLGLLKQRNPLDVQTFWEPESITKLKQIIVQEFGPNPVAHSLWADEPYGWIDNPRTDQDLLYNKLLYDWSGYAYRPQVRVPATEWLIHYTRADFTRFNRARRFQDNIKDNQFAGGHSSYMIPVDCQKPLSEIPYGFQFAWSTSHMLYDRYYPDTIWQQKLRLFRSDSAVQHLGDSGEVVFRACSEQDLMSFTFKGQINRDDHTGVWVSDETGESFESPLKLVQWADARIGIQRIWPLPLPGYFTSIEEVRLWAQRIKLCTWSAYLQRSLQIDLLELEKLPPEEAVKYFNKNYRCFSFLQGK